MDRREYKAKLLINGVHIKKVIIDPHYEEKHSESINDKVILELVQMLDGKTFEPDAVRPPYTYYVTDRMSLRGKKYKLIWLLEEQQIYVGVINAYRRK